MASEEEKILTQKPAEASKLQTEIRLASPAQVTTKDPNKVAAGKRLAEYNRKKREELKRAKLEMEEKERAAPLQTSNAWIKNNSTLTYGVGIIAISAAAVVVGYKVWKSNERKVPNNNNNVLPSKQSTNKFNLK